MLSKIPKDVLTNHLAPFLSLLDYTQLIVASGDNRTCNMLLENQNAWKIFYHRLRKGKVSNYHRALVRYYAERERRFFSKAEKTTIFEVKGKIADVYLKIRDLERKRRDHLETINFYLTLEDPPPKLPKERFESLEHRNLLIARGFQWISVIEKSLTRLSKKRSHLIRVRDIKKDPKAAERLFIEKFQLNPNPPKRKKRKVE